VTRDAIAGLVVLVASLALFALTLDLKGSALVPIGPGFYPRVVLGVTAVLALALVVSEFMANRGSIRPAESKAAPRPNYALVAVSFGTFALYCAALPSLGFRIATFAYVVASNVVLSPPRGIKGWVGAVVLGLATSFITWLVFEHYLSVLLPRGRWTGV
jgi:putative tricarboxylic transport membrane protein